MSPHAYTEDQFVEQSAIGLFAALDWQTVSAMEETFGARGPLRRVTKGEVVLTFRLREALKVVETPMAAADGSDGSFTRLFRFITGANEGRQKI